MQNFSNIRFFVSCRCRQKSFGETPS